MKTVQGTRIFSCLFQKGQSMNRDVALKKYVKKMEKAFQSNYFDEKDKNGRNILSSEKNVELFVILRKKYETSIFKNQMGVVGKLVKGGEEKFKTLSIEEQIFLLLQIIKNIQISESADLRLIGGAELSGKNMISKRISNANEVILITQSVTGLYQAEINLLMV